MTSPPGSSIRTGRHPAGPLSDSKLCDLLRDRYYLGIVTYKDEEYPGRHEPLVEPELFERVQEVLQARRLAGERQRVHHHYLKGTIWCGACKTKGRESRLLVQKATGASGGTYFYFFCSAKQQHQCDEPYTSIDAIEAAVEDHYQNLALNPDFAAAVRDLTTSTLADEQSSAHLLQQQLDKQLAKLDRQENNLLDLAADGTISTAKVKTRLRRIATDRTEIRGRATTSNDRLEAGATVLDETLRLLDDPGRLYGHSDDHGRRLINQAIFTKLYIHRGEVTHDEMHDHIAGLVTTDRQLAHAATRLGHDDRARLSTIDLAQRLWPDRDHRPDRRNGGLADQGTKTFLLGTALAGSSSSKDVMVELLGSYSNSSEILQNIRSLLDLPPTRPAPRPRQESQRQRRLNQTDQLELVEAYRAGASLVELATRFGVHRRTAARVLKRHDVTTRYRISRPLDLVEIARRYAAGDSLAVLGQHFGVDGRTIQRAMVAAGIPTRPRTGQ